MPDEQPQDVPAPDEERDEKTPDEEAAPKEFEQDPARNPDDPQLDQIKGG